MSIQDRQNQPESLAKLAAQRLLYRYSKRVRNLNAIVVVLVGVSALATSIAESQTASYAITVAILASWLLDELVLKERENAFKTEGATIQEDFDCFVLDLPWPVHKGIQRPTPDRVKQLATVAKGTPGASEKLENWYTPDAIPSDPVLAKIHCQRMNCWWDVNLRRRWTTALKMVFWGVVVLALFLAIVTGVTVAKLVVLTASGIRILAWGIGETKAQNAAIKRIERIHGYLSELLSKVPINSFDIRGIQDEIFEHRRSNPPVPDWFYWRGREGQELDAAEPQNKQIS